MKKLIVTQEEISDCGVCSLLSIIRYYGGNANLEELRIDSKTTSYGVNAYDLIECAKKNGFDAKGSKLNKIDNINLPCIVHLNINKSLNHFAALYEISDGKYTIMDPAKGLIYLNEEEFYKLYTGFIIELVPKNIIPNKIDSNTVLSKIYKEIIANKKSFIKLIVISLIILVLNILNSLYIKIYDYPNIFILLSVILILVSILDYYFNIKLSTIKEHLYNKIYYSISNDFFSHILKLPLKYLHIKDKGEIIKRNDEVSIIVQIYINIIINIIYNCIIILPLIVVVSFINIKLLLFILLDILLIIINTILASSNTKYIKDTLSSSTDYNNIVIDYINCITTIKHSKCDEYVKENISSKLKNKLIDDYKYNIYISKITNKNKIISNLFILLTNIYLVNTFIINNQNISLFIIINSLLSLLTNHIDSVSLVIPNISLAKLFIHKVSDFYSYPEENIPNINIKDFSIKIKKLSFSYGIKKIMQNFSINLVDKEKVFIKGKNGSGKSTLCKLINKEYTDYDGKILIGNKNLKNISSNTLRKYITYSSQSEKIITGTIKENILLGKNISDNEFNKIYKICRLNLVVKDKPFKLDTFLYGGGEELSGGQRQLIILARSLINKSNIMIYDESLSEVSSKLEEEIVEDIRKYLHNETLIYITHKEIMNKNFKTVYV